MVFEINFVVAGLAFVVAVVVAAAAVVIAVLVVAAAAVVLAICRVGGRDSPLPFILTPD